MRPSFFGASKIQLNNNNTLRNGSAKLRTHISRGKKKNQAASVIEIFTTYYTIELVRERERDRERTLKAYKAWPARVALTQCAAFLSSLSLSLLYRVMPIFKLSAAAVAAHIQLCAWAAKVTYYTRIYYRALVVNYNSRQHCIAIYYTYFPVNYYDCTCRRGEALPFFSRGMCESFDMTYPHVRMRGLKGIFWRRINASFFFFFLICWRMCFFLSTWELGLGNPRGTILWRSFHRCCVQKEKW